MSQEEKTVDCFVSRAGCLPAEAEGWAEGFEAGFAAYRSKEGEFVLVTDSDLNSACAYTRGFAAGYRAAAE